MPFYGTVLIIFLTGLAVSYGWGMRGALIGGEKGAMLPGALLGFFLARFSGIPVICDNAVIFSAVGCLAMGYGGFEPYAQTMEMVLHKKSNIYSPKRGYAGLAIKGGNWFGICGGILGIAFTALGGEIYKLHEIVILFILIPFVQVAGIKLLNKPYEKKHGIFPKIYFSRNSREEWGGNLFTLILIFLFTAIKKDWFAFFFAVTGMLGGAIGWAISIWLYKVTITPNKKGKYIFGKLQEKGYIDNWKIMEFSLGFLGGISLATYFFIALDKLKIFVNVPWSPLGEYEDVIAWISFALAIAAVIQYFVKMLRNNRFFELCERTVYFSLLLCLCVSLSQTAARFVVFPLIVWVAVEQIVFDELGNSKFAKIIKVLCLIFFAFTVIDELFFEHTYFVLIKLATYTYFYIALNIIGTLFSVKYTIDVKQKIKGHALTVAWFTVLSTVIIYAI